MATTFKFGNKNWAVKEDYVLAYNDENDNFKPLPFDFTRATTATYVDSDGLIKTAQAGYARIDYTDNTDGHLLLEPSRTNIIEYSEDFSQSYWSKSESTVTLDSSTISPNGSAGVYKLAPTTANANHTVQKTNFTIASGIVTAFLFAKKGTERYLRLRIGGTSDEPRAWYDLEKGIVEDVDSVGTAYIEDYGNGWYKCGLTVNSNTNAGAVGDFQIFIQSQSSIGGVQTSYAGDVNQNLYIWGAQVEQGSYPTSYIPTEGSSVTRNVDVCNGAGSSDVFNDSEGVLFVETEPFIDGDFESQYISLQDGTTGNNFVTIQHRDNGQLRVYAGGFNTANIQFLQNLDMAQNLKIAVQYKESDYKLFVNGTEYSLYSSGGNEPAVSGLSELSFTVRGGTSNKWLGKTKQLKVYNTALSDSELETLTT